VNILASYDAEVRDFLSLHLPLPSPPLQIHGEVKNYVGQVFEELDTEQADILRAVDAEVVAKEDVLRFPLPPRPMAHLQLFRGLRDDMMTEKKMQENLLKDMRNLQQTSSSSLPSTGNGKSSRR
jgi:iron-sulfur cluster repair protein YtfE (RIC family)